MNLRACAPFLVCGGVVVIVTLSPAGTLSAQGNPPCNPDQPEKGVLLSTHPVLVDPPAAMELFERFYPLSTREPDKDRTTFLWVLISEEGKVEATTIATTSGLERADVAADSVARAMAFLPGTVNDQPACVWLRLPFSFSRRRPPPDDLQRGGVNDVKQAFEEVLPGFPSSWDDRRKWKGPLGGN